MTDIDTAEVYSRDQLIAAINAMAQPTHEQAKRSPFIVRLGRTKYYFKEGVTERRADKISKHQGKYPKAVFKV